MVYMYHSFLIHSSADGHLGCFYVPAIINSASMNIGVHVSLSDLVSLATPVFLDFPCGSAGKESACNVGDLTLIPVLGRSPGEGKGYPLQYSGLENAMGCIVHGLAKSPGLSDFTFTFSFHCMYCHSLFSSSPPEGHLAYFEFLAIRNKAARNICVQVFVWA